MDTHVLVDYDNVLPKLQPQQLAAFATRVDAAVQRYAPATTELRIRLFGGWYNTGGLTNSGTILAQHLGNIFPIPIIQAGTVVRRIFCEIASSLVDDPKTVLHSTIRTRKGIRSPLTPQYVGHCGSPADCTLHAVSAWSRGQCPVPGCSVTAEQAFTYREQKLVDTLLCCDLIALSGRTPVSPIFVISDDDDMLPALLLAARAGGVIWRCHTRLPISTLYRNILQQVNIQSVAL